MPIEFSVAAFRLGHAMIRERLRLEQGLRRRRRHARLPAFIFSGHSGDLGGSQRLPSNWIADFRRLYDFGDANEPDLVVPADKFNQAMRIDTRLADTWRPFPGSRRTQNLAFRNLSARGW